MQKAIAILDDFSLCSKFREAMMRSLRELSFNVEKEYVLISYINFRFLFEAIDGDMDHVHMLCF